MKQTLREHPGWTILFLISLVILTLNNFIGLPTLVVLIVLAIFATAVENLCEAWMRQRKVKKTQNEVYSPEDETNCENCKYWRRYPEGMVRLEGSCGRQYDHNPEGRMGSERTINTTRDFYCDDWTEK